MTRLIDESFSSDSNVQRVILEKIKIGLQFRTSKVKLRDLHFSSYMVSRILIKTLPRQT